MRYQAAPLTDNIILQKIGALRRIRTAVHGFAIRCLTTQPSTLGAGGWIRTTDTRFWRPPFYQLNYTHIKNWLGWQDSNLRMSGSKPDALTNLATPHQTKKHLVAPTGLEPVRPDYESDILTN